MFEGTSRESDPPAYFDTDGLRDQVLIGTPEDVAAALRERLSGLPVTDLMFWADYPGLADELVDRHIELSLTRLAPLLGAGQTSKVPAR
jgi:hypothetical protein